MLQRLLTVLTLGALVLCGQSNQASISGTVTDAQGAAIPGARVNATNTATDVRTGTVTNEAGFYSIPNLPIGAYIVTVEHEGFRRYQREGITLTTARCVRPPRVRDARPRS